MVFSAQRHAFSIVEVMMATTILLVGFMGFIRGLRFRSGASDRARRQRAAKQTPPAEIEKLRGKDWTTIASLPSSATITIGAAGALTGDLTNFALSNYTA